MLVRMLCVQELKVECRIVCVALQVDIYSFGVVLWEIVTQDKGRRGQLRRTRVPEECPAEIESLIDQ